MVFVVFAILFMFGGWFLTGSTNTREDLQVRNYISFALTTTSWLILPVALLMSCWGVPEDIKARSIHTVVTKPARRWKLSLEEILGYVFVGSVVLILMGFVGNVWVHRQVSEKGRDIFSAGFHYMEECHSSTDKARLVKVVMLEMSGTIVGILREQPNQQPCGNLMKSHLNSSLMENEN